MEKYVRGGLNMKYYSTVDNVVMTHSGVLEENGFEYIKVHFERSNKNGVDFADLKLPGEFVTSAFGFSEDEIIDLKEYARDNEPLVWELAREGSIV